MDENTVRKVFAYRWLIFGIMAIAYVFVYFPQAVPRGCCSRPTENLRNVRRIYGASCIRVLLPLHVDAVARRASCRFSWPPQDCNCVSHDCRVGQPHLRTGSGSLDIAVAARVMVGLGVSMVFIPTMKILSQWFRIREFAFMTAILTTMGGLGALVAATPLALMTGWVGWRVSFEIIAAGTFLIAILVWLFVRNRPQDMGWPSVAEIDHIGPGASAPPIVISLWEGARRVITERRFWPVAVWFFFICGIFFSFGGLWAGPYLMHVYRMTRAEAGHILNMIAVGMIIGSPLVSLLSDRVFHSRKKVLTLASAVLFVVILWLNIFPQDLSRFLALRGVLDLLDVIRCHCRNRLHHYQGTVSC